MGTSTRATRHGEGAWRSEACHAALSRRDGQPANDEEQSAAAEAGAPSAPIATDRAASDDTAVNLAIVRMLQNNMTMAFRGRIADLVAKTINETIGRPVLPEDPRADAAARHLRDEGYAPLGPVLSAAQVTDIVSYLSARPCFDAHVPGASDGIPRRLGEGAEDHHYGSYALADVVSAPHLLELANHPTLIWIAARYLGCLPTLYSLNAWWSFAGHGKAPVSQEFHRDLDEFKFCTLFVFLTEVGPTTGAHVFIRRSHRVDLTEAILRREAPRLAAELGRAPTLDELYGRSAGYGRDALYEALFRGCIDTITGPAGTALIADTGGLHKGVPLTEGRRLMFWARYGLYRNTWAASPVSAALAAGRLPSDPVATYINRCIIAEPA